MPLNQKMDTENVVHLISLMEDLNEESDTLFGFLAISIH